MNIYLIVIIGSMVLGWAVNTTVSRLNAAALDPAVPQEFADVFDAKAYASSQEYTRATSRYSLVADTVGLAAMVAFILLGGFPAVDAVARAVGGGPLVTGLVFMGILLALNEVLFVPFALYRTFVLEERFGFNTTTFATFAMDRAKSWLLTVAIGGPILAMLLWFFTTAGELAWLWAWGALVCVMVGLQYIAPTFILPLFNTFTPLEPGQLRDAIESYIDKVGFELSGLFVIDGSRRSAKSNAFFTGFGKRKRIALFDTLIDKHTPREIVAIVAHEVGHSSLGHVRRFLVVSIIKTGVVFWLMSFFLTDAELAGAFGMAQPTVYAGLVFFMLLYTPVSLVLSVAAQAVSRRHEYEADRFAARTTGDPEALVTALKTLSVSNLSNLTPHPAYVFVNYSHPPVLDRIRALRRLAAQDAPRSASEPA